MTFDLLFIALGGAASFALRFLKAIVPPFRRWFDESISDEDRQAMTLVIGLAVTASVCGWRLWGTDLPDDPKALVTLFVQCGIDWLLTLQGQAAAFRATNKLNARREAGGVVQDLPNG